MICTGMHKVKDHRCGIIGYIVNKGKICIYVIPKCANCGKKHQATAFRYLARVKTQAEMWKQGPKDSKPKIKGQLAL